MENGGNNTASPAGVSGLAQYNVKGSDAIRKGRAFGRASKGKKEKGKKRGGKGKSYAREKEKMAV